MAGKPVVASAGSVPPTGPSGERRGRGRPPLTTAERAQRRVRLVEGAMAAIRELGAAASVEQLAVEMGVSKPVLYAEFGDKEGIGDAVGEELARLADRQLIDRLTRAERLDVRAAAEIVIDALFTLLTNEQEIYAFIVRCVRLSDRRLLDNGFVRALDDRVQLAGRLLAPGLDPAVVRLLAHGALGFVVFAAETWQDSQQPSREELIDAMVGLLPPSRDS